LRPQRVANVPLIREPQPPARTHRHSSQRAPSLCSALPFRFPHPPPHTTRTAPRSPPPSSLLHLSYGRNTHRHNFKKTRRKKQNSDKRLKKKKKTTTVMAPAPARANLDGLGLRRGTRAIPLLRSGFYRAPVSHSLVPHHTTPPSASTALPSLSASLGLRTCLACKAFPLVSLSSLASGCGCASASAP